MLYGYTPFRGKTRQKTFANILHKDLKFPKSKPVNDMKNFHELCEHKLSDVYSNMQ